MLMRYAKSCNHVYTAYHATGKDINAAIITSLKNLSPAML